MSVKGQIISKQLLVLLRFFQKTNKWILFFCLNSTKNEFVRLFFGRIWEYQKFLSKLYDLYNLPPCNLNDLNFRPGIENPRGPKRSKTKMVKRNPYTLVPNMGSFMVWIFRKQKTSIFNLWLVSTIQKVLESYPYLVKSSQRGCLSCLQTLNRLTHIQFNVWMFIVLGIYSFGTLVELF